jgi:hypothetical protein
MALTDRPTPELVLLIFATLVGLTVLLTGAGLFIVQAIHPELDMRSAIASLGQTITLIVGAVVGYLAGAGRKGLTSPTDDSRTPGAGPSAR